MHVAADRHQYWVWFIKSEYSAGVSESVETDYYSRVEAQKLFDSLNLRPSETRDSAENTQPSFAHPTCEFRKYMRAKVWQPVDRSRHESENTNSLVWWVPGRKSEYVVRWCRSTRTLAAGWYRDAGFSELSLDTVFGKIPWGGAGSTEHAFTGFSLNSLSAVFDEPRSKGYLLP